jgi:molybdopterin biosynthesis enzyme MoaB
LKKIRVIYAERSLVECVFADCGTGGIAVDVTRTASLNVFVRPVTGFSTQVNVNTHFKVSSSAISSE